LLIITLI